MNIIHIKGQKSQPLKSERFLAFVIWTVSGAEKLDEPGYWGPYQRFLSSKVSSLPKMPVNG